MVIKALIFVYYKQDLKIMIKSDFFDYVNSGTFSQLREDGLLYFFAFFSKNLNFIKYNYKIYEKKLLAIIKNFEQ